MTDSDMKYKIGISLIPGIGSILAKKLIAYTGSVEGVFKEKKQNLLKIPGIGEVLANEIVHQDILERAEHELAFIEKYHITTLFYLDKKYPERLKCCDDAPVILFLKGNINLNHPKILSIVGTRNATQNGKECCEKLVADLAKHDQQVIVISGLAYGIDICAHKAALSSGLPTVAVLGHGLKTIYPAVHKSVAQEICKTGALVTDFFSDEPINRNNFISRNRIIAGLADATIVVESGEKGGALITADIANSYNRDVFAFPGRVNDKYSAGCNQLIKNNKAILIEGAGDLEYVLGWAVADSKKVIQKELFVSLSDNERQILDLLEQNEELTGDAIALMSNMPVSKISPLLLNLEFSGIIKNLPGNIYKLSIKA